MRILELCWEYPPYIVGGLGQHVSGLIRNLGGQNTTFGQLQVKVVTTRYAAGVELENDSGSLTVYRVNLPPLDAQEPLQSRHRQQRHFAGLRRRVDPQ